jgi:cell division protein FtsW
MHAAFNQKVQKQKIIWSSDYWLLGIVLSLLILGLIMVGSASVSIAEKNIGEPFYYLWRQMMFSGIGLFAAFILVRIPMRMWQELGPALVIVSLLMLLLVFIPGLGKTVNGSTRWIAIGGFNLQASEFVKLFTILYLAGYLVRHSDAVRTTAGGFWRPLGLLMIIMVLLLLEPDFGAAAVLISTAVAMMWLAGVRISQFIILLASVSGALALLVYTSSYRMQRLTGFMDPWQDPFDSGFQLTQALIAFGRGEWFGVGLGASVQKLFYLPEAHTDFLFAVLAEELGLLGVIAVIILFTVLVYRILLIGRRAETRERPFAGYVAYGIGIWIGLQAFINIGVNMGVLPTKGLTLPFMSYGGSSIVVMCMAVALLVRIDYETRKDDRIVQRGRQTV